MSSETELVNAALRKVGGRRITDIADTVPAAGVARDILASERDDLLRSHPWNFAITRVILAPLSDLPVFEFQHAFALPTECMRVVSLHVSAAGGGDLEYKVEAIKKSDDSYVNAVLCNPDTVYLRYVRQVEDYNLMTPTFRQVLILRLAKIFATGIAKSNTLFQLLNEEMKAAMRCCVAADGIEDYPDRMPEGSWAQARRSRGRAMDRGRW